MSAIGLLATYLFILAVVTAISLSLIRWLRQRHWSRGEPAAEGQPLDDRPIKAPAARPRRLARPARRRSMGVGLAALGIGLCAQYALTHEATLFGGIGYFIAVTLFVIAMRPFLVRDLEPLASHPAGAEIEPPSIESRPLDMPPILPGQEWVLGERVALFKRRWQLFTLADVLAGFRLPEAVLMPEARPLLEVSSPSTEPVEREAIVADTRPPAVTPLKRALVTAWTGDASFTPQAIIATPQGDLLALDVTQDIIHRFNSRGELLERWLVPGLPQPQALNLAVSPDGNTLYVADAANRRVQVISLVEKGDSV